MKNPFYKTHYYENEENVPFYDRIECTSFSQIVVAPVIGGIVVSLPYKLCLPILAVFFTIVIAMAVDMILFPSP